MKDFNDFLGFYQLVQLEGWDEEIRRSLENSKSDYVAAIKFCNDHTLTLLQLYHEWLTAQCDPEMNV